MPPRFLSIAYRGERLFYMASDCRLACPFLKTCNPPFVLSSISIIANGRQKSTPFSAFSWDEIPFLPVGRDSRPTFISPKGGGWLPGDPYVTFRYIGACFPGRGRSFAQRGKLGFLKGAAGLPKEGSSVS